MIGLYVHVPYCRTVCPYCDFVKRPLRGDVPHEFLEAIHGELDGHREQAGVSSIFFGGGTPSLLSPKSLEEILERMDQRFNYRENPADFEITLEANPDDVNPELVAAWRDAGINRISLGVQSFDDEVLAYLGRRHDADGARKACELVGTRFENWNVDLIFGAPPLESWASTLSECRAYDPPHVSTYALSYEDGTPFEHRKGDAVDGDTSLRLVHEAIQALDHLDRYEVSNFARPGFESRHNLVYWHNEEYLGLGPGAYSFLSGVRSRNHCRVDDYLRSPGEKIESLSLTDREIRTETLIQHFRLKEGLSKKHYYSRFGSPVEKDFYEPIDALCRRGLLEEEENFLRPTEEGFDLNNEIGLALVG